jgi:hypothetical protein
MHRIVECKLAIFIFSLQASMHALSADRRQDLNIFYHFASAALIYGDRGFCQYFETACIPQADDTLLRRCLA